MANHTTRSRRSLRRSGAEFELDLVLRDNQTSAKYPDGIFHPHQDVQHIKKKTLV